MNVIDAVDQSLIKMLQGTLPLTENPYQTMGEKLGLTEDEVVQRLQALGLELDKERNQQLFGGRSGLISKTDTTKIAVIPTNEEKMIAIDAAEIARTA